MSKKWTALCLILALGFLTLQPSRAKATDNLVQCAHDLAEALSNNFPNSNLSQRALQAIIETWLHQSLPESVSQHVKAEEAFSRMNQSLKSGTLEITSYKGEFYVRDMKETLSRTLPLDPDMNLPDGRNPYVRYILSTLTESLATYHSRAEDEKAYLLTFDVNALKQVNDYAASILDAAAEYRGGKHSAGNWVLQVVGQALHGLGDRSFISRTGGDELTGVAVFANEAEAMTQHSKINVEISKKMEPFIADQKAAYTELLQAARKAKDWSDLPEGMRTTERIDFAKAKRQVLRKIRTHLFLIEKNRPSLSVAAAQLDPGLFAEANQQQLSPFAHAFNSVDALLMQLKNQYKLANGIISDRGAKVDTRYADKPWISPPIHAPIVFKRF